MKEYLEGRNLITKLQAKHDLLQKTLGESECGSAAGGLHGGEGPALGCIAEPPTLSQPWSGCVNALLFLARDVEARSPDGCLSNGNRPVLNEALMCIVYLFKWSVPALRSVPFLRLLCCDLGKRLRSYLLSRHFVKTLSSSVAGLRLEQEGREPGGELPAAPRRREGF